MSMLPDGFAALEPFAERWSVDNAAARDRRRSDSGEEERQAFFAAATPMLDKALEQLDAKPLAEHDERERRLMHMMLTLAHIASAVESQGPDEAKHAVHRSAMRIMRAPADA